MNYIKKNYKFIICMILILVVFTIKFPYYIDAPGGISDVSKKIELDGYESEGSFNLAYVKEYRASIPTLLISFFNKDWKVLKLEDVMLDTENYKSYEIRDKILMEESISNAIYVAYTKANKNISIKSSKLLVTYILESSNSNLLVGDEIISVNDKLVKSKDEVTDIIESLSLGSKLSIKVINNNKEYIRYAYIIEEDGVKKIGILISNVKEYDTKPKIKINIDSNESGPSGGLITALSIYNSLISDDITNGLKIVGTGTIEEDGTIGSIGGVEYKLKSAVKKKADLFIVPNDSNYEEAITLKEKNNYDIDIIGVSTLDEVLNYLDKK